MRRAILIASATFDQDSGIEPLRFPANDAAALESVLRAEEFGFTHVTRLVDQTNNHVFQRLDELISESDFDDFILIYFSGHGKVNSVGELFLSCRNTKETLLNSTGLKYRHIMDLLETHARDRVAIILDCCYAGRAVSGLKGSVQEQVKSELDSGRGIFVFGASGATQTAQERELEGHGVFTKQIIEGLTTGDADLDNDGQISLNDLAKYVRDQLRRKKIGQDPIAAGMIKSGDLILGVNRKALHVKTIASVRSALDQAKHQLSKSTYRAIEDYLDEVSLRSDFDNLEKTQKFMWLKAFAAGGPIEEVIAAFRQAQEPTPDGVQSPRTVKPRAAPEAVLPSSPTQQSAEADKSPVVRDRVPAQIVPDPALTRIVNEDAPAASPPPVEQAGASAARSRIALVGALAGLAVVIGTGAYLLVKEPGPPSPPSSSPPVAASTPPLAVDDAKSVTPAPAAGSASVSSAIPPPTSEASPASAPSMTPPLLRSSLKWRLASSFPKALPELIQPSEQFVAEVRARTQKKLEIQAFASGEIVPGVQVLDAVAKGTVEVGWTYAGYYWTKDTAFGLVGGGSQLGIAAASWVSWANGDGNVVRSQIYAENGVIAIPCSMFGPKGLWVRRKLDGVKDLNGLKLRMLGPDAATLPLVGAVPQYLSTAEIYPALEKGVIDGAQFGTPVADERLGFHKVARYYYYPASDPTLIDLIINKAVWGSLEPGAREALGDACRRQLQRDQASLADGVADALRRFKSADVIVNEMPAPILSKLRQATKEMFDQQIKSSAGLAIWASLKGVN